MPTKFPVKRPTLVLKPLPKPKKVYLQPVPPSKTARKVIQYLKDKPIPKDASKEARERAVFIKAKAQFIEQYIKHNLPIPSSFVDELEWVGDGRVCVSLNGNWYTYLHVKESVFARWAAGLASCITDDPIGGKKNLHRKRWIKGKTPSVGAFYNKYIKGRYTCMKGRHNQ